MCRPFILVFWLWSFMIYLFSVQARFLQSQIALPIRQSNTTLQTLVTWDEHSIFVRGERVVFLSGEVHPFRLPSSGWEERIPSSWGANRHLGKAYPSQGLTSPGVGFFSTQFDLSIPEGFDVPISLKFGNSTTPDGAPQNFRVQIFINGWQLGKYGKCVSMPSVQTHTCNIKRWFLDVPSS